MRSMAAVDFQRLDDVGFDERVVRIAAQMGDVFRLAGDEIVDADDFMALAQEQVGQVRAEKARGAGNQNSHIV